MPRHLYIELTTLCNLGCAMCVKHSAGWTCDDGLMPRDVFTALQPVMAEANKLTLNGIGESLLHPDVEDYIAFAREHTQPSCLIDFQSNGMLLTASKVVERSARLFHRVETRTSSPALPNPGSIGTREYHRVSWWYSGVGISLGVISMLIAAEELTRTAAAPLCT